MDINCNSALIKKTNTFPSQKWFIYSKHFITREIAVNSQANLAFFEHFFKYSNMQKLLWIMQYKTHQWVKIKKSIAMVRMHNLQQLEKLQITQSNAYVGLYCVIHIWTSLWLCLVMSTAAVLIRTSLGRLLWLLCLNINNIHSLWNQVTWFCLILYLFFPLSGLQRKIPRDD